ncbi:MAG: hypothetical protein L0Y35_00155, partial [Flammeovirgaceae bacterium]|nr:hypothetical protein [Flammeovirgaceae bacterium]
AELTLEECLALAEAAPEKKGRFGRFVKKKEEPKIETEKPSRTKSVRKVVTSKPAKVVKKSRAVRVKKVAKSAVKKKKR